LKNGDTIDYIFENKNKKYFSDFKIIIDGKSKIIEIKDKHYWYYEDMKSGKLQLKCDAVIKYSIENNYLDFELLFPEDFE
jgi:hypothetical protein